MTDRAPDVIGEIIAWRAWTVIGDNERLPLLGSVTHASTLWHPQHWTHATCNGRDHCGRSSDGSVPGEKCSCGLYAAKTRQQLITLGYWSYSTKPVFVGEVGLAGKVIPGDQGWRAEKGRIVRLYVPFEFWSYVEPLEALYGAPVVLDNTSKVEPTLGHEKELIMEIGKEDAPIIVEPLEDPFETPAPDKVEEPAKVPEPEKVPAGS